MNRLSTPRRAALRVRSAVADRTKRAVKVGVSACLYAADSAAGRVSQRRQRGHRSTGVVLMYHDISPRHRGRFAEQCEQITRLGTPTALGDMHASADGSWRIAVTFDDGFRSFAHVAVPELDRCGIPSTLFVPTEWARRSEARDGTLALVEPDGSPVPMTPAELAKLSSTVEIGSHSRTHPHLPTLADDELSAELAGSRSELDDLGRTPVRFHAFPYGEHDARVDDAARAAGYERCYGVAPAEVRAADGYVVGRVQVEPTDWPIEFRLKVLGAYRWMSWWMTAKERLRAASDRRGSRLVPEREAVS